MFNRLSLLKPVIIRQNGNLLGSAFSNLRDYGFPTSVKLYSMKCCDYYKLPQKGLLKCTKPKCEQTKIPELPKCEILESPVKRYTTCGKKPETIECPDVVILQCPRRDCDLDIEPPCIGYYNLGYCRPLQRKIVYMRCPPPEHLQCGEKRKKVCCMFQRSPFRIRPCKTQCD